MSPEVVVIAALPLKKSGTDANVQVRGVTPRAVAVHEGVRMVEGRFLRRGFYEIVVGRNATTSYSILAVGDSRKLGGGGVAPSWSRSRSRP